MALYVSTNVSSLNANRNLANATNSLDTAYRRLASGLRINSARDDAAGLQISNRLTSQINGLNQGNRNAQDGISYSQTAEGAMDEMVGMYQRIRTLALQAANGSNSAEDRKAIQQEVTELCHEITRIGEDTTFGGIHILNKSITTPTDFQVGANANETVSIDLTSGFRLDDVFMKLYNDAASDPAEQSLLMSAVPRTVSFNQGGSSPVFDVTADYFAPDGQYAIKVTQMADSTAVKKSFPSSGDTFGDGGTLSFSIGSGGGARSFNVAVTDTDTLADIVHKINTASGNFGLSATLGSNGDGTASLTLTSSLKGDAYKNLTVNTSGAAELNPFSCSVSGSGASGGWSAEKIGQDTIVDISGETIRSADNTVYSSSKGLTVAANRLSDSDGSGGFVATNITVNPDALFSVENAANAQNTLAVVDKFIACVDSKRAELGAVQNRLESTIRNQTNVAENVSDARSRIRDADFASETAAMTQQNILQQASQSILSQANQRTQVALSLLQS